MRVALAFLTKDRIELSKRTIEPLLRARESKRHEVDVFWIDGSKTVEGERLPFEYQKHLARIDHNVRGGADAAIVYALTLMLGNRSQAHGEHNPCYDFVGLCENDVLLDNNWFDATMGLFYAHPSSFDGLCAGAVSARSYVDRVLIQRQSYAVMHNLGAGQV